MLYWLYLYLNMENHKLFVQSWWWDVLTRWHLVTHICIREPGMIGVGNGLSPVWHHAISSVMTNCQLKLLEQSQWNVIKTLKFPFKTLRYIGWLVQEKRNSIANALEIRLSCTNPSICRMQNDGHFVILDVLFCWLCQLNDHISAPIIHHSDVKCTMWDHDVETCPTLLVLCEGNPRVKYVFCVCKLPVMCSFDVLFYLFISNKLLNKQSSCL